MISCIGFKFNVAFITWGGFQILAQAFNHTKKNNVLGQIITTSYQHLTDPKVIETFLNNYENIEIKVVDSENIINNKVANTFHPKGYIFEYDDHYKILIGSVNMTEQAMKKNVEWSLLIEPKKDEDILLNILDEFNYIWNNVKSTSSEFVSNYKNAYHKKKQFSNFILSSNNHEIKPNKMQIEALEKLNDLRLDNKNKALVVAATGVGKTFLSAFDVKQFNSKKTLFIVHREEILKKSKESFEKIINNKTTSIFKGANKETNSDIIFASHQTLHRNLDLFKVDEFDYIIIDEAHHTAANTYLKVIEYFKPKFLLGMTATPERMDGENIWELFENNIAIDIRLKDAIDENLIIPFHYFGISDISSIDLSNTNIDDLDKVAKKLMVNERVDYIIEQMNLYQYDGENMNCIAFCVNKEHAKFMSDEFNKRGLNSDYLVSGIKPEERAKILNDFEDDNNPLKIICVVDIANEGLDIPKINLVLFLRPTNSPIIFLQQLGRGLRKYSNKKFLTVLDFIGNHNKSYLIPYAFSSFNNVIDEPHFLEMVKNDFKNLSNIHIEFDEISKNQIFKSINSIKTDSEKWIKNEYMLFKNTLKKIPFMQDYLIDGAPNIFKIIKKYKNYFSFLLKIENDKELYDCFKENKFEFYINYLSSMLPIYRINEFIIIDHCIKNNIDKISLQECWKLINVYTKETPIESIKHTFRLFNNEFYDNDDLKIFIVNDEELKFSKNFKEIIFNKKMKRCILDCLDFGINYFFKNYNLPKFQKPFVKVGQKYRMKDILAINSYGDRKFSSFFGQGVYKLDDNFYFFITLIKDDFKNEEHKYNDGIDISSRNIIYWESPNDTSQESKQGKEIINHNELGININIFIRKHSKDINFNYLGMADVIEYEGNKPIKFKLKLKNPMEDEIFYELSDSKIK